MANLVFRPHYDEHYDPNEKSSFVVKFDLVDEEPFSVDKPDGRLEFNSPYIRLQTAEQCDFVYSMFIKEFEYRINVHILNPTLTSFLDLSVVGDKFTAKIKPTTPDDVRKTIYILLLTISQQDLPVIEFGNLENLCVNLPTAAELREQEDRLAEEQASAEEADPEVDAAETESVQPQDQNDECEELMWDDELCEIEEGAVGGSIMDIDGSIAQEPVDLDDLQLLNRRDPLRSFSSKTSSKLSSTGLSDNMSQISASTTSSIGRLMAGISVSRPAVGTALAQASSTPAARPLIRKSFLDRIEDENEAFDTTGSTIVDVTKTEETQQQQQVKQETPITKPNDACLNLAEYLVRMSEQDQRKKAIDLLESALVDKALGFKAPDDFIPSDRASDDYRIADDYLAARKERRARQISNSQARALQSAKKSGYEKDVLRGFTPSDEDDCIEQQITAIVNKTVSWGPSTEEPTDGGIVDSSVIGPPRQFRLGRTGEDDIVFDRDIYDRSYFNLEKDFDAVSEVISNIDTDIDRVFTEDDLDDNQPDSLPRQSATGAIPKRTAEQRDRDHRDSISRRRARVRTSPTKRLSRELPATAKRIADSESSSDSGNDESDKRCARARRIALTDIRSVTNQLTYITSDTDKSIQPIPPDDFVGQVNADGEIIQAAETQAIPAAETQAIEQALQELLEEQNKLAELTANAIQPIEENPLILETLPTTNNDTNTNNDSITSNDSANNDTSLNRTVIPRTQTLTVSQDTTNTILLRKEKQRATMPEVSTSKVPRVASPTNSEKERLAQTTAPVPVLPVVPAAAAAVVVPTRPAPGPDRRTSARLRSTAPISRPTQAARTAAIRTAQSTRAAYETRLNRAITEPTREDQIRTNQSRLVSAARRAQRDTAATATTAPVVLRKQRPPRNPSPELNTTKIPRVASPTNSEKDRLQNPRTTNE